MIEQPWVANSLKLIASKVKGQSFKDCLVLDLFLFATVFLLEHPSKSIRESGWSYGLKPAFYPSNAGFTPTRVNHRKKITSVSLMR